MSEIFTSNDCSLPNFESEWTATIAGGVKLLPIGQCACEVWVCGWEGRGRRWEKSEEEWERVVTSQLEAQYLY